MPRREEREEDRGAVFEEVWVPGLHAERRIVPDGPTRDSAVWTMRQGETKNQ